MQTLLNMACTMLADSGLPQKFWADAVNTAVYIWNFIPTSRSPSTIPVTAWSGQRQDIYHLWPFGSTAYAHILPEVSLSKLAPHLVKLTMIGYYDKSGYRLLDRTTDAVFKSRDVIFEESWPHYSTDPIVSFPDAEIPSNPHPTVIAPRPKQTTQLHPMLCKVAKLQAGIKPTALCSVIDKENLIEFPLDFLYYLYNYYMVCALLSHAYHVTHHVTLCDVMLWLPVMWSWLCDTCDVILSHTPFCVVSPR